MDPYSSHPTLISTTEHVRRQQKPLFYYSGWLYDDFYTRDHLNALHAACMPYGPLSAAACIRMKSNNLCNLALDLFDVICRTALLLLHLARNPASRRYA
jgi:hypothetical protein